MDEAINIATFLVEAALPHRSYWPDLVINSFSEEDSEEEDSWEEDSREGEMYWTVHNVSKSPKATMAPGGRVNIETITLRFLPLFPPGHKE